MIQRYAVCAVVFAGLAMSTGLHADAPPTAEPQPICSLHNKACATPQVHDGVTRVAARRRTSKLSAWRVPVIVRAGAVADDGSSLVQLPDGANLIPVDAEPHTIVLTFWFPAAPPVRVCLSKLVEKPASLPRTTSHVAWATSYRYEGSGVFVLTTREGVTFRFDARLGKPTNRAFFGSSAR